MAVEIDDEDGRAAQLTIIFDRRRQVGDQVYEALKKAIVSLRLPPGASISENRICRQIGVSRTPVRAAIIRLVEDGLIEVFPQKGSFVAPIKLERGAQQSFHPQGARNRRAAPRGGGVDARTECQVA